MPASHVHFNGSVNLADTESVMREITARVPSGLRRIPDGETGDRAWLDLLPGAQVPAAALAGPRAAVRSRRGRLRAHAATAAGRRSGSGHGDMARPGLCRRLPKVI